MQVSVYWRRLGARGLADGMKKRVQVGMWILMNWPSSSYCLKYLTVGTTFVLLVHICTQLDLED
jgi:hypothetical protein